MGIYGCFQCANERIRKCADVLNNSILKILVQIITRLTKYGYVWVFSMCE